MRLLTEILTAVRAEVAGSVPVGIRISAAEMVPGGLEPDVWSRVLVQLQKQSRLDFLNVSLGSPMAYPKVIGAMDEPLGYELPYSVPVARSVQVPAIVAGRIKTLAQAEEILGRGDAQLVTPQFLMAQAYAYLRPGVIMLGHANHPTVLGLFDQISQLVRDRRLQPVTLDEMFGTSR